MFPEIINYEGKEVVLSGRFRVGFGSPWVVAEGSVVVPDPNLLCDEAISYEGPVSENCPLKQFWLRGFSSGKNKSMLRDMLSLIAEPTVKALAIKNLNILEGARLRVERGSPAAPFVKNVSEGSEYKMLKEILSYTDSPMRTALEYLLVEIQNWLRYRGCSDI